MSLFSGQQQSLQWWKCQEVYRSSLSCFGLLDGAVLSMNNGKPAVVVRGWLFDEGGKVSALHLRCGEYQWSAIPYGLERGDVKAVFGDYPQSLHSGFLSVFYPNPARQIALRPLEVSFTAKLKAGGSKEGFFNSVPLCTSLTVPDRVDPEGVALLENYLKTHNSKVVIVSSQLNNQTNRNLQKELSTVLSELRLSYHLLELSMFRSNSSSVRYAAIQQLTKDALFILVGREARELYERKTPFLISSHTTHKVLCITDQSDVTHLVPDVRHVCTDGNFRETFRTSMIEILR